MALLFAAAIGGTSSVQAQAPEITSADFIQASPGDAVTYDIEASNSPDSYGATAKAPNAGVNIMPPNPSGAVTITVAPNVGVPLDFVIVVSATNADGTDTQEVVLEIREDGNPSGPGDTGGSGDTDGPVDSTGLVPGSPRIFQGKLAVKTPKLKAALSEVSSDVVFSGVIKGQGELQENAEKGTSAQAIVTKRVSNKTILELMKVDGAIDAIPGYNLKLAGQADGAIADLELVAAKKDGTSAPVPATIFSFQTSEGIEGYKEKANTDGDVVQLMREQYLPVTAEWKNKPGSSERISLTGIGKVVAKLKFYKVPGESEPSSYEASALNVNLSGYGDGSAAPAP